MLALPLVAFIGSTRSALIIGIYMSINTHVYIYIYTVYTYFQSNTSVEKTHMYIHMHRSVAVHMYALYFPFFIIYLPRQTPFFPQKN